MVGSLQLAAAILFTKGVTDEYSSCSFDIENSVLVTIYVIDTSICVTGTWMFISPLRNILRSIENRKLSYMLRKTKFWSIVCLVSTLVALFVLGVIDGVAGFVTFDC